MCKFPFHHLGIASCHKKQHMKRDYYIRLQISALKGKTGEQGGRITGKLKTSMAN